ncbi:MAG TPA: TonB family protein [Pyrinomonadaceae bacterium]|jgi:TonB family protein|nr:TonB family protein [Pyrinomonadaceae bacterium]
MRRILSTIFLVIAAASVAAGQANAEAARAEINAGGREYRDGNFAAAEEHFRRALELDPTQKNTQLFIARAVQQQFKPGDTTPENVATGERAVAAYQEILAKDPENDDAYRAMLYLYGQMKNEEKVEEMLTQRAGDGSVKPEKRAEALVILASRRWKCSYDITERKENKTAEAKPDKVIVKYRMPADSSDFYKAQQCATEGLQLAEQAVALDPDNKNAWAQKANLLREKAKLAEMEGNEELRAEYMRQFNETLEAHLKMLRGAQASQSGDVQNAPEQAATPSNRRTLVSGGVLNGKAIYKPQPAYPPDARAARAAGTVTVQILVDEEGNVVEAHAVSGHPLLRDAAETAARNSRFSPTRLQGQPVKVSGVITYSFVLQ